MSKKILVILTTLILGFFCSSLEAKKLKPSLLKSAQTLKKWPEQKFKLSFPGAEHVYYEQFGQYLNPGTTYYQYKANDIYGLKNVTPEGIYPNQNKIFENPEFLNQRDAGKLNISHWAALNSEDLQTAFFAWSLAKEDPGVKTFFIAQILEKSGNLPAALAAYSAVLTFYPRSMAYTADGKSVWYVAAPALAAIERICRDYNYPYEYTGADISIQTFNDENPKNDLVKVSPGTWQKANRKSYVITKEKKRRGSGKVQLVQYENGHWQMLVENKPFMVNGILYAPTQIGLGPKADHNFSLRWMYQDLNKNGKIDAPYDAWLDINENNVQDKNEKAIGDFKLMKDMGVNAIKIYHYPQKAPHYDPTWINKDLMRELYQRFGIRVIVGDFIGAYTIGSGADWMKGTDYTDPAQCERLKKLVRELVLDLKDEDFVLMWILGNENNMPSEHRVNASRTNAYDQPVIYAQFLNQLAAMIHELDPNHPVAIGNLETPLLDVYAKYAPEIDIVGINSYRGKDGFGTLWRESKNLFDRPLMLSEFGSDAYSQGLGTNQDAQAEYLEGNLRDIAANQAGGAYTGNSIGGVVFQYLDEWWKDPDNPEDAQQTKSQHPMPFADGQGHEEWFGIIGQGNGENSPFQRNLRKAYFTLQKIWKD